MTVFTSAYAIPTSSTPYPSRPRGLSTHVSSPLTRRALLRRLNSLLVKEHLHPPQPRTPLAPVFSLPELTPHHLLRLLELILATSFDLGSLRERHDQRDESWQSVLDDDDHSAGMDEQQLHDERILRFLILGLQQALETTSLPERDIETMLDVLLLADIDSSHPFGGSNSTRSGVKLVQQREHIIAWIVAGLFEIEDRLLDPLDNQLDHSNPVDGGEDSSSHMVTELGIATTASTCQGTTTSATPTTPRKLLFRDSHTQSRTIVSSPLKQALTTYLPPSPSPRLETTPRKSIVELLRRDKQHRSTSPTPKSKKQTLEKSSLMLVKPEMERYERSRPTASIIGVKMARKRDVSDSAGESDLDLSERTCDCETETEGYRETGEGDQTEAECSCCIHMDEGSQTLDEPVDAVPIHRLSDLPLNENAHRWHWHLTVPKESKAKLFPPTRFVTTPLNRHSPTSSSSSSNEDEYVVNLRRKRERDELEKIKLRSCGLDTDLECGPSWVTGWSEKELQGLKGRR